MIWLSWRQHRTITLISGTLLVAFAALILSTGLPILHEYQQVVARCGIGPSFDAGSGTCPSDINHVQYAYQLPASVFIAISTLAPFILAILIAAPLVAREFEQHTFQLIWTQSATRRQWLLTLVGTIIGGGALVALSLSLLVTWWRVPLDALDTRLAPFIFDSEGIAPLGYMTFALMAGITAGAYLRRTMPAIAVTLISVIVARIEFATQLRYTVMPPLRYSSDLLQKTSASDLNWMHGAWMMDIGFIDHTGKIISNDAIDSACSGHQYYSQCIHDHGWLSYQLYEPASRFWSMQAVEFGSFLVLAAILFVATYWRIVRHPG